MENAMNKLFLTGTLLASMMMPSSAFAEEPWTEFRFYIFATEITGDAQLGNVSSDVDVSFNEILTHLDLGFMGTVEHRRAEWSFIVDIAYLKVSDDHSRTVGPGVGPGIEIDLEAELAQTVIEGFAGYRFHENAYDSSDLGIDVLFGARHTALDIDISLDGSLASSSASGSRDREEDWVDAVIGVRFQNDFRNGWGSSVWLDVGDGSDSSSYQGLAIANYTANAWRFFGGWRLLHLEYETGSGTSKFGVDLDYNGPVGGVSYRF
jgi:hypothetical protein